MSLAERSTSVSFSLCLSSNKKYHFIDQTILIKVLYFTFLLFKTTENYRILSSGPRECLKIRNEYNAPTEENNGILEISNVLQNVHNAFLFVYLVGELIRFQLQKKPTREEQESQFPPLQLIYPP